ncbi:hypothetical protein JAAARDRAFT_192147 [Jaapia argillacea MUCL 33604]|uniref:Uncharacterized protein n=1 Tax=Jaapia argillacea MUCL 33604 TaxID=933084 RepID=A0A067Q0G4_9AGAM|nr:hypothetical protein JAAARDRAFT_192147 [Jaapia argillacea MUCL 33604]
MHPPQTRSQDHEKDEESEADLAHVLGDSSYDDKVALIEVTDKLRGTCVNVGCMTKKTSPTEFVTLRTTTSHAQEFVLPNCPSRPLYPNAKPTSVAQTPSTNKSQGYAKLLSLTQVEVTKPDGTKYVVEGVAICVATDGSPTIPTEEEMPGASLGINSDGFFDPTEKPKRVAVAVATGRRWNDLFGLFGAEESKGDNLDYTNISAVVFLCRHPPIETAGLTEPQAREKYWDVVKIYKSFFRALYLSMIDERTRNLQPQTRPTRTQRESCGCTYYWVGK